MVTTLNMDIIIYIIYNIYYITASLTGKDANVDL